MQMITTIGLDIAKSGVPGFTELMPLVRWVIPPAVEEALRPGVLPEAVTMLGWHRGLRLVPLLVARELPGTWPYRAINAAGLCKAPTSNGRRTTWLTLRLLRSGHQSQHAVRANKDA